jgi:hypothetical protein
MKLSHAGHILWLVKSVSVSHVDPQSHSITPKSKIIPNPQFNGLHNITNTSTHQHTATLRHRHTKTPCKMKHCNICASDGVTLRVSPKNHEPKHGEQERACGQCWEAYLSLQVEEKNESSEIECMFCKSEMSESDFQSLAQKGTKVR